MFLILLKGLVVVMVVDFFTFYIIFLQLGEETI